MKVFLEKAIFNNIAPFDKLELDFTENEVAVLSAVNGRGKTTMLSYIVDAFYEMARPNFGNSFEGIENKLYRISSGIYNLNQSQPSFVYFRFITPEGNLDYLDIRNCCSEDQYNQAIFVENKIEYNKFKSSLDLQNYVKLITPSFDNDKVKDLFQNNLLTYFPSYRFESPGYLNEPYNIKLDFTKKSKYSGQLKNPIEVISGLPQLANWILDVVLDLSISQRANDSSLINHLNSTITQLLSSKKYGSARFGIGPRGYGVTRIQILENKSSHHNEKQIYPNIFNLSSGESSMLCLFGELLRQADNLNNSITLQQIQGIVLVDEIDKHLHIKLQKEILPGLVKLFPNVQFIISSHSPFFSMGLAEVIPERSKIIDFDNLGVSSDPTTNDLYKEVYDMMISENDRFKEMYQSLEQKVLENTIPLIITEGKTDVQHLKRAKERLNIADCNIDFFEINEDWGETPLSLLLEQLCKVKQTRRVIGIFDRDVPSTIAKIEKDGHPFKDYSNNVYGFCLPVPQGREKYKNISIEFYYPDANLKKTNNNKCLYFDNEVEFRQSAQNKSLRKLTKLETPIVLDENNKKVFDENIGGLDWIHSKAVFANLVETDEDFTHDFDFSQFHLIFDKIKTIINL